MLWRELCTRAYGTKPFIIKLNYLAIFVLAVFAFHSLAAGVAVPMATNLAMIPVALGILSLMLINAQGVTALTSERDLLAVCDYASRIKPPKELMAPKGWKNPDFQ